MEQVFEKFSAPEPEKNEQRLKNIALYQQDRKVIQQLERLGVVSLIRGKMTENELKEFFEKEQPDQEIMTLPIYDKEGKLTDKMAAYRKHKEALEQNKKAVEKIIQDSRRFLDIFGEKEPSEIEEKKAA